MGKYLFYSDTKDTNVPWLGKVPKHWRIHHLKRAVEGCINGIWGTEPDGENDVAVIRVADFDRNKLQISVDDFTMRGIPEKDRGRRLLQQGDLLIEKSGGGEKQFVGVVVLFDKTITALTSNFVARMPPVSGFGSGFLRYAFHHLYSGKVNYPSIKQATGIQNLDAESYLTEYFCFPSQEEQQTIAAFLDHGPKGEGKDSLSSPDAPMKDSGVEWRDSNIQQHYSLAWQRGAILLTRTPLGFRIFA